MLTPDTPQHSGGGIYNYFQGATIHNIVINGNMTKTGAEHYYAQNTGSSSTTTSYPPEVIVRALTAVNGRGRAVDSQRAWLGVCLLLGWKHGFPRDLKDCCQEINKLPIDWAKMEYPCKYDSIRMFGSWKFVQENVEDWPTLTPRSDEREVFNKCLAVAQTLEKELEKQAEG